MKRHRKGKKCKQWVEFFFIYIYKHMRISKQENNAEKKSERHGKGKKCKQ